ncbi:MAG: site-specific integrase, partial [Gammaproteobacteria bacterium]|nr:site-specific integrase [Gammaproteobacteria bacterium]
LFCAINKGGKLDTAQQISTTATHFILSKRAEQAGVQNVTWHDFRRSWISDLWDKGVDGATIAELAGHSSVDTTKAYDRRGERTREQAAGYISVPYFD